MKEAIVSKEIAKLARSVGFTSKSDFYYDSRLKNVQKGTASNLGMVRCQWEAPTLHLLSDWLREEKGIFIAVESLGRIDSKFYCRIAKLNGLKRHSKLTKNFQTFYEALEAGVKAGLELLK